MALPPIPNGYEYLARRAQRRQSLADSMLEQATSAGTGQQNALSPLLKIAQAFLANKVQGQADTAEQDYGREVRGLQAYELDRAQKFFTESPNATEVDTAGVLGNSTSPVVQAMLKARMEEASKRRIAGGELKSTQTMMGADGQPIGVNMMADGTAIPLPNGMRPAEALGVNNDITYDKLTGSIVGQLPSAADAVAIRGEPGPGEKVGQIMPNPAAIAGKSAVAQAGRAITNNRFDVQTQSTLGRLLPTSQIKLLDDGQAAATTFVSALPQYERVEGILKSGKIIAGFGANARLDLARFADLVGLGGADNSEKITNSQTYIRETGNALIPILLAFKPASDTDVVTAKKMAANDLSLTPAEMQRAISAAKSDGMKKLKDYNSRVDRAIGVYGRQVPEAAAALEMYRVQVPEGYKPQAKPASGMTPGRKALLDKYGIQD